MWLSRPVYEFMPYAYMLVGTLCLIASFFIASVTTLLMWAGMAAVVFGLVLWLKRRDYRTAQSEYNRKSLDE